MDNGSFKMRAHAKTICNKLIAIYMHIEDPILKDLEEEMNKYYTALIPRCEETKKIQICGRSHCSEVTSIKCEYKKRNYSRLRNDHGIHV